MRAYAVAHLHTVQFGQPIVDYLQRIDETLEPFGGRFLVHGGHNTVLEGDWNGDLIVIEFPDMDHARDWYASPAYQAILPLRTENSEGPVILAAGVGKDHRAVDVLKDRPSTAIITGGARSKANRSLQHQ